MLTPSKAGVNKGFRKPGGMYGRKQGISYPEKKSIDTGLAAMTFTADAVGATAVQLLNGCMRGDDINNRQARQIQMKSILVRGVITPDPGAGTTEDQAVRYMIVYDKQPNPAAAPVPADFMDNILVTSPNNLANRERFVVLLDRELVVGRTANPGCATVAFCHEFLNVDLKTTFNATNGGTFADINTGALWMLTRGQEVAAGAPYFFNDATCRVRFTDD